VQGMGGEAKAGNAAPSEMKKWEAKRKALPVEAVTTATQTDHIEKVKAIPVGDVA